MVGMEFGLFAERQIFINTLNMGSTPQYKENPDVPQAKKAVSFALETPEGCARFIEEYRNGEYLALAVTLEQGSCRKKYKA